jgi:hypothetical protein
MPRVDIRCPRSISDDPFVLRGLVLAAQRIVAREMSGRDYDGEPFTLDEKDVEVFVDPYESSRASVSHRCPMTITGYDYPDRMGPESLRIKMTTIADDMGFELGRLLESTQAAAEAAAAERLGQGIFSTTFIPYGEGCYGTSSR